MGNTTNRTLLSTDIKTLNFCEASDYIQKISGLTKNSASTSDQWIVDLNENIQSLFPDISSQKAFCKVFLSDIESNIEFINNIDARFPLIQRQSAIKYIHAMNYEQKIYSNLVTLFLQKKLSPNFLKIFSFSTNCTFDNLLLLLKKKIPTSTPQKLKTNLLINIASFTYFFPPSKRGSINTSQKYEKNYVTAIEKSGFKSLKLNVLLLESISPQTKTLKEMLDTKFNPLHSDLLNPFHNVKSNTIEKDLNEICFQIFVNLYLFSLIDMIHNDLHTENIFIEELSEEQLFIYVINEKPYFLRTKYKVIIYDFDHSYCPALNKNNQLEESSEINNCLNFFRCNEYSKFDLFFFTFLFGHETHYANSSFQKKLFKSVFKDDTKLYSSYGSIISRWDFKNASFEQKKSFVENCNDPLHVLNQIYKDLFSYENFNLQINSREILEKYTYFINDKYIDKTTFNFNETVFEQSKTDSFNKILQIVELLKNIDDIKLQIKEKVLPENELKEQLFFKQNELETLCEMKSSIPIEEKEEDKKRKFEVSEEDKDEESKLKKSKLFDGKKKTKKSIKKRRTIKKKMKKSIKKNKFV
jgi:hypothetical protein